MNVDFSSRPHEHHVILEYVKTSTNFGYSGKAQGLEEGKAQGLEEGKAQGLQEGKTQGMQQSKIEIAKKMLSKGISLDLITEMTGLSEEEIKTL